ncbi:MAG: efflux RND transporter periplasmic adaptor subunit [Cyclobacteriaceae bacterium]|nr:efflux RND transporter periplasmic adaptor subunit [Cyclobacteriaceae bacterium]
MGISSCGPQDKLQEKREELKEKKIQLQEIRHEITLLEKEIASIDPEFAKDHRKATLISTVPVEKTTFSHFVEVSGAVKSRKNVLISSENMGTVQRVLVKEGNDVKRGQLLMTQDTELYQKNLDRLETEYELAITMFEKQANLWNQRIGTEVQYLESKNRKESLEDQIANVKTQIAKSQIRAPFDGTIEEVSVKEGEMAQIGSPLVRIVNHKDMYVKADVSESYIGQFKRGDQIDIYFPSLDKSVQSTISSVGQIIDEQNRTFSIEALLPAIDFTVKPNLLAVVKVKDFEKENALVVPSKLIQKDNKGDFVFVAQKTDSSAMVAKKVQIKRGITYQNQTLVEEGLSGDEVLVDEGFRDVADGAKVKEVANVL